MENSKIEWTNNTFNPWVGCTKVSQGCKNCYAEELMDRRYKKVQWGPTGERVRTSEGYWKKPFSWNKQAFAEEKRYKVFCASLADVFEEHKSILPVWRLDLGKLIERTPNLDWLLLTKRPENVFNMCADFGWVESASPDERAPYIPDNVWIGTSVEDQENADKRVPELLKIPARIRFLSCEPLLAPVYLENWRGIDWVIVGGESGANRRQINLDWARSLRDQCRHNNVPFFFKQVDKVQPIPEDLMIREFPIHGAKNGRR